MVRRTPAVTLVATILVITVAALAGGYALSGYRWAQPRATWKFDASVPTAYRTPIANAANSWSNAGSDFRFVQDSSSVNVITFEYIDGAGRSGATTQTWWDANNYIIQAVTKFDTSEAWGTDGSATKIDVQSVAAHEFGHWLRLMHSDPIMAVMYSSIGVGEVRRNLYQDDIDGIKAIYGPYQ